MGRRLEQGLQGAERSLEALAASVDGALEQAVQSLARADATLAERVIAGDEAINTARHRLQERCVELLATQQPVAEDVRELVAMLGIATELERMGDYAASLAGQVGRPGAHQAVTRYTAYLPTVKTMARQARDMLCESVASFRAADEAAARNVCAMDDAVDTSKSELSALVLGATTLTPTEQSILLKIPRALERVADRATNIAEWTLYTITGEFAEC